MDAGVSPAQPLLDIDVLIVDCQTTGASPAHGSVLELGWCLARASDPERDSGAEAHWITPAAGERISAQVRQLTGFDETVLEQALPPEEAWRRLRTRIGDAARMPAAIHFARFELSFLRDWSERFEPRSGFPLDAVCVHAIACRLYPDLPRRNLRALSGFLGHGLHLERRSLGHVQATAFIWRRLVAELAGRGIHTWQELTSWLATPERPSAPRKRRYPLPPARYRELPDAPGVYRFLRSNGDVLYVGKATSLKKRVSSHFTKQSGATERALEMLTQVSEIAFVATSSALEAALLETQTIKTIDPPYNVQLVQGERGVWFSSTDWSSVSLAPDETHCCGPFSSRFSLRALGVLAQLLAGAAQTTSRRAGAVGAPTRWAPDEAAFTAGFALFSERYCAQLPAAVGPRRQALGIARHLLLLAEAKAEPETETEPESESMPHVWDGPRVCRHLERSIAQCFQVLRRAAWLCRLANSAISYREPGSSTTRFLVVENAAMVDSGDLENAAALPAPRAQPRLTTQLCFDAGRYDSLRILSTELKRIQRDGGSALVRLSRSRALSAARLAAVLRLT